jgi:hypothetical protein
MNIPFNLQYDFTQIADGAESVTLLRRGSTPGESGTVIAHALRQAISIGETTFGNRSEIRKHADSDAHAQAADVSWHLPLEELLMPPQLGDVILDEADCRWTILQVDCATLGSRWKCFTRALAIAHGLDDTISILSSCCGKCHWLIVILSEAKNLAFLRSFASLRMTKRTFRNRNYLNILRQRTHGWFGGPACALGSNPLSWKLIRTIPTKAPRLGIG